MKPILHARKQRQLHHLAKQLNRMLRQSGTINQEKVAAMLTKAKKLAAQLSPLVTYSRMKKLVGPAAVILGMVISNQAHTQSFSGPLQNPFGISQVKDYALPCFVDLDGDGDFDLLLGEYSEDYSPGSLRYFENVGTRQNPQFGAPQTNPFGLDFSGSTDLTAVVPSVADLDGDGDFDLFTPVTANYSVVLKYYENIGTRTNPQFGQAQDNPFGLSLGGDYLSIPTFVDLDDDGDTDVLIVEYYGDLKYYENTGTPTSPQFGQAQVNPFGLNVSDYQIQAVFADFDRDGDMDMLMGEYYGNLQYFENIGDANSPQFAAPRTNAFGLQAVNDIAFPAAADLDGDGDPDLLVGEYGGNSQYFENTATVTTRNLLEGVMLELSPNPVQDMLFLNTNHVFDQIEIFSATGQLQSSLSGVIRQIDTRMWNKGVYLIKFLDADGRFVTKKVVKN